MTVVVADVVDYDYGPTQPIVAGAVSADSDYQDQQTRPNTAAGRASAISPRKDVTQRVLPQGDTFIRPIRSRRRMAIAITLLVLLVLAGLAISRAIIRNNYYVAGYEGNVSIMRGIPQSILGLPLHKPYLLGCLNGNQLSQISYGQSKDHLGCHLMKLEDLRPPNAPRWRPGCRPQP
ncbi:serine/threonine phosphatase 1 domain protein [Mycobacterium xenopi 3993]|nr:serine/threonine phosphatase 1 domain protein [Mycobacterium xenopi 3993]